MNTEALDIVIKAFSVMGGIAAGLVAVRKWVWRPLRSSYRSLSSKWSQIAIGLNALQKDMNQVRDTITKMEIRQVITSEMLECIMDWEGRGFFRARTDGYIEVVSSVACRLAGRSERELIGHNWLSRVHLEDRQEVQEHWESAREDGRDFEHVFRIHHAEDGWIRVRMRAMPIPRNVEPQDVRMYLGILFLEQ